MSLAHLVLEAHEGLYIFPKVCFSIFQRHSNSVLMYEVVNRTLMKINTEVNIISITDTIA